MSRQSLSEGLGPRIVIIGTGVGGLSFAIGLKRRFGYDNFTIFEKAEAVGGTWRDNIYPGCSSDIPVQFYSLSTDPNPDWSSTHPFHDEIQAYWEQLSEKHSITPHIVFGRKVVKAVWDPMSYLYHITTEDVASGQQSTTSAEIVISAIGFLEVPRLPDIPGISDFRGTLFHSARWSNTSLDGKRVAVIGNGASATQFLPIISKKPNIQVMQFCRTPNWLFPPIRMYHSRLHKLACRYLPLYMRIIRFLSYSVSDISYFLVFSNSVTRRPMAKFLRSYILKNSPKKYHENLVPNYGKSQLGCKRAIFDSDYLPALHQSNVELNWSKIDSIAEDGIITRQGEHLRFDTIILATGFSADKYPLIIYGKNGQTIQEYFNSQGGPTAYLGTTVPGFPNFYVIGGPNTATGHTSVIFTEEVQVNYIIQLIKPILEGRISSIDVTARATDRYNAKIQARLARSVFMGCTSWYRAEGSGKVTSMFPGASALFWWWLRRPIWEDYDLVGGDGRAIKRSRSMGTLTLGLALAVAILLVV
ncbi:hypothetical protein D9615_010117 [Tricholomella constricta]|uniref:Flavin-containing monooxygenase n=1 Tax=Tricholomella constricta TaxID=117010 RepID=A0A8H5GWW1_9AGAR|nr:hypothetical protein D9615_010117 [Tricholomella constricta]